MQLRYALLTSLLLCLAAASSAQTPTLLKDLNPGADNGSPTRFFVYGERVLFRADSGPEGVELWITDGTPAGTTLLKDINTDATVSAGNSNPDNLIEYKGKVYFSAREATTGIELWVTDGTPGGTMLLKDINPGTDASSPLDFVIYNDLLYFTANDGTNSSELWVTDGTAAGTQLAVDIFAGGGTGFPNGKYVYEGKMYFTANSGTGGSELHSSDGTVAGTQQIKDIRPGSSNSLPSQFYEHMGTLYFRANDGSTGTELWKTDGTATGTVRVLDLRAGSASSSPGDFQSLGGLLYFTANDGTTGNEPWQTAGDSLSTKQIADLNPGSGSSSPTTPIAIVAGQQYFVIADAGDDDGGAQPFILDADGDLQLELDVEIRDRLTATDLADPVYTGSGVYFAYENEARGTELGYLSAASEQARAIGEVNAGDGSGAIDEPILLGNLLLFEADNGTSGRELYVLEASTAYVSLLDEDAEVLRNGDTLTLSDVSVGDFEFFFVDFDNAGTDTAVIYDFEPGGNSETLLIGLLEPSLDLLVPPGSDEQSVAILYAPETAGSFLDSFVVSVTTVGGQGTYKIYLSGTALLPVLELSTSAVGAALAVGSTLDFTGVDTKRDSTQSLFVRNAGEGVLLIDTVVLAQGTVFSVGEPTDYNVENGTPAELRVTFASPTTGSFRDTLTVRTFLPGADSVFTVFLTATATSAITDLGLATTAVYPNPVQDFVTVELAEAIPTASGRSATPPARSSPAERGPIIAHATRSTCRFCRKAPTNSASSAVSVVWWCS